MLDVVLLGIFGAVSLWLSVVLIHLADRRKKEDLNDD